MIKFTFDISNPFSDRFNCVYNKDGPTWITHKFWELGIYQNNSIISFNFSIRVGVDHPGFSFEFSLFGWSIFFDFYDERHDIHLMNG